MADIGEAVTVMVVFIAAVTDLRTRRIPNVITLPAGVGLLGLAHFGMSEGFPVVILWSFVSAVPFLVLHLANPGDMGGGDVKLAGVVGAGMGSAGLVALVTGCLLALGWGVVIARLRGCRAAKIELPLAPFIGAGVIAVIMAG